MLDLMSDITSDPIIRSDLTRVLPSFSDVRSNVPGNVLGTVTSSAMSDCSASAAWTLVPRETTGASLRDIAEALRNRTRSVPAPDET